MRVRECQWPPELVVQWLCCELEKRGIPGPLYSHTLLSLLHPHYCPLCAPSNNTTQHHHSPPSTHQQHLTTSSANHNTGLLGGKRDASHSSLLERYTSLHYYQKCLCRQRDPPLHQSSGGASSDVVSQRSHSLTRQLILDYDSPAVGSIDLGNDLGSTDLTETSLTDIESDNKDKTSTFIKKDHESSVTDSNFLKKVDSHLLKKDKSFVSDNLKCKDRHLLTPSNPELLLEEEEELIFGHGLHPDADLPLIPHSRTPKKSPRSDKEVGIN